MHIGYNQDFIGAGYRVPLPRFSSTLGRSVLRVPTLRDDKYSDYVHFTVVMNENTRQLIYSAYNIDQAQFRPNPPDKGKRSWRNDPHIEGRHQLDNDYYKDRQTPAGAKIPNPYDRGHMVMRFNNMWGADNDESDRAGKATFVYSNSSLQHENLNRDEWKELELNIVRTLTDDSNDKLSVFTGPIFGDLDRHVNLSDADSARVPSGFFKVVCYERKNSTAPDKLGVLAFAIFQDAEVLRDKKGSKQVKTNHAYQVTISEIQDWTGIKFDDRIYNANPLLYRNIASNRQTAISLPERIPVTPGNVVVAEASDTRPDVIHLVERQIVITSAMINPKGDERSGEWVSLLNRGMEKIDVGNWRVIDGHGREAMLRGSIESGNAKRLKGQTLGKVQLSNSEGSLSLLDDHGCLIDYVTWSKPQIKRIAEGTAFLFDNQNN